jgi:hypothetical protein
MAALPRIVSEAVCAAVLAMCCTRGLIQHNQVSTFRPGFGGIVESTANAGDDVDGVAMFGTRLR